MSSVLRSSILAVLASVSLAGCPVPLPPGYEGSSRQNVPGMVPVFIKPAETSREDVMMCLGEPDAVAVDESWISYGSSYGYGGIALIMAAGGGAGGVAVWGMRYRRLIVPFDRQGFAVQPIFEAKNCTGGGFALGNAGGVSAPCLDIWGSDLPEKFGLPAVRP